MSLYNTSGWALKRTSFLAAIIITIAGCNKVTCQDREIDVFLSTATRTYPDTLILERYARGSSYSVFVDATQVLVTDSLSHTPQFSLRFSYLEYDFIIRVPAEGLAWRIHDAVSDTRKETSSFAGEKLCSNDLFYYLNDEEKLAPAQSNMSSLDHENIRLQY